MNFENRIDAAIADAKRVGLSLPEIIGSLDSRVATLREEWRKEEEGREPPADVVE